MIFCGSQKHVQLASWWFVYMVTCMQLNSNLALTELSTDWLDPGCAVYCVTWLYLNCLSSELTLAEPSTGSPNSIWTVYWVTWLWLNCILGWFDFSYTFYWVTWPDLTIYFFTWFWLNCWLVKLTLAELSSGDLNWAELCTGWPWIIY